MEYLPDPDTGDLTAVPMGIEVGSGGGIPTGAQGVEVITSRTNETFLASLLGIAQAAGDDGRRCGDWPQLPNACPTGGTCPLLPVTFPTTQVTCDGQNKAIPTELPLDLDVDIIVPLCGNFPGGVGWIDWTPTGVVPD